MSGINYRQLLTASEPYKPLVGGRKRAVGRNSAGRITSAHRGAGAKRLYRQIDFAYDKKNITARIETVEYDPNRTAFVALALYADGERRYVIIPQGLAVGDSFTVSEIADIKSGNRLPLKKLPPGTFVYNVELQPGAGARLVRSAGSFAEVLANDAGYTNLKLPSGEVRKIPDGSWASIGTISNPESNLVSLGKAGRSRWMGRRPKVRGTAQNPVDHPYGGGEGRQGRGTRRPKTRWGKVTGGRKTRTPKKYSNVFMVSRRPKKLRKR